MKTVCEYGVVTEVRGTTARVRLVGETACRRCGLATLGLCTTGGAGFELEARCPSDVRSGERVRVLRGGKSFAEGGGTLFGIPLAALVLGALGGHLLGPRVGWPPDLAASIIGFACLALALLPVLRYHRLPAHRDRFIPTIEPIRNSSWI